MFYYSNEVILKLIGFKKKKKRLKLSNNFLLIQLYKAPILIWL
ncbi:unnamed protein product, partial [marine sediment metagenome]